MKKKALCRTSARRPPADGSRNAALLVYSTFKPENKTFHFADDSKPFRHQQNISMKLSRDIVLKLRLLPNQQRMIESALSMYNEIHLYLNH